MSKVTHNKQMADSGHELGPKSKAWALHFTWLGLEKSRVSKEMQTVYCGVKCAVEVGVLGKGFMIEKRSNFLGKGIPEKMTWAAKRCLD